MITMKTMTTHERMQCMMEHREADRVPVLDNPWSATLERWHREGMPENVSVADYFGLDRFEGLGLDSTPHYPIRVLEETDEYTIATTVWGTKEKSWKHAAGAPEYLDFTITSPDAWRKTKERIVPARDRIDWAKLKIDYQRWQRDGYWKTLGFQFGFNVTQSFMVGTERLLIAMIEQPEWVVDMFNHLLDVDIAMAEMVLAEGYTFDNIMWCDDMGYKEKPFFSVAMYRELLKPVHKRAMDWAHSKGLYTHLHSCGDIRLLVPDLIDAGLNMLNPIEVKAGMDPIALKKQYGDRLGFHGGLNVLLYDHPEKLWAEMRRVIPVMKQGGGYFINSDHSVPDTVSLKDFTEFVRLAKELGTY